MTKKNEKKPQAKIQAPFNPNKALEEMIATVDSLRSVYRLETEALAASDTKKFLALQDDKLLAARKYQHGVEAMASRRDEMKAASPRLRERLQGMHADFSALAAKNLEALERMRRSTERLGDTIMQAARDAAKRKRTISYAGNGALSSHSERKAVSMGVSETA